LSAGDGKYWPNRGVRRGSKKWTRVKKEDSTFFFEKIENVGESRKVGHFMVSFYFPFY
jgi:hypothetical protein